VQEAELRDLDLQDIRNCIPSLYYLLSRFAHGNLSVVTVRPRDFHPLERALIVTILKLQSEWPDALEWWEEPEDTPEWNL